MKTDIQTERGAWTSASNAEADALCPGRHLAQRGLPEESSDDAESGQRIHAKLAGEKVELSADEETTFELCQKIETDLLFKIFADSFIVHREQRLWVEIDDGKILKHSGKPDAVFILGKFGLVIDYKTGRNEVAESSRNAQLRDLAVMASDAYGLKHICVAVIQPLCGIEAQVCEYSMRDLVIARSEMEARVIASNQPDAKRVPGEKQCKYCKAKASCPESIAAAVAVVSPDALQIIPRLSPEKLASVLDQIPFAENIFDAVRDEAKRRLTDGEPVPGYALKPGAVRETISNPQECFNRCNARGVTLDKFMSAVTIAKGKLKDAVKAATGEKGKTLDASLATILDGITEEKQAAPSLVQVLGINE